MQLFSSRQILRIAYLAYATIFSAIILALTPPYQHPDEPGHFMRAWQIAHGQIFAGHLSGDRRRMVDAAISASLIPLQNVPFRPQHKVSANALAQSNAVHWGLPEAPHLTSGTATYPPFLYIPAALGIRIGEAMDLSVVQTLKLSRAFNATCAIALGAAAMWRARSTAPAVFTILLLPMAISQGAAATQDSAMISMAALYGVIISEGLRHRLTCRALVLATILAALIAAARPPYLLLSALLVFVSADRRQGLIAFGAATALCIGWLCLAGLQDIVASGKTDVIGVVPMLHHIVDHPLSALQVVGRTTMLLRHNLFELIGVLGWIDVYLPGLYYGLAIIVLFGALFIRWRPREVLPLKERLWVLGASIATCVGVVAVLYLTFTSPTAPIIEGIQGRYFLPPLLVVVPALPWISASKDVNNICLAILLAFPGISIAVTWSALLTRYYG